MKATSDQLTVITNSKNCTSTTCICAFPFIVLALIVTANLTITGENATGCGGKNIIV